MEILQNKLGTMRMDDYYMKKILLIIYIICFLTSFVSCERVNDQTIKTEVNLDEENIFDNKPLKILLQSDYRKIDFGLLNTNYALISKLRLTYLFDQISEECNKKFGFPVYFFSIENNSETSKAGNEYLLFLESGSIGDLIFPIKADGWGSDKYFYWNDEFINNGYYMDLTPYLNTYCPDVYFNMQKYGYVKDMVTREDKVYALYAGIPTVFHMSLQVKNDIVNKYNVQSINNFDDLYSLLETMYKYQAPKKCEKILVTPYTLLEYAVIKAGYYPVAGATDYDITKFSIVCKIDDIDCKPYLIEDTDIFDVFLDEFVRFFEKSYFLSSSNMDSNSYDNIINSMFSKDGLDMRLSDSVFEALRTNLRSSKDTLEHSLYNYSMFLFDMDSTIVQTADSIQLILVPYTCTQPKKALAFVNWLFTDDIAADLLTFGTDKGQFPCYKFDDNGNITYYQDGNSVYAFYNLIANFSDRLLPFGNKTFDRTSEYKELSYKADYPPLYQKIESQHSENYFSFKSIPKNDGSFKKRTDYIEKVIYDLFEDPRFSITVDEIKEELRLMTYRDDLLNKFNMFMKSMLK